MTIFGLGFRFLLIAFAVVLERVGTLLRELPWVQRVIGSPPGDLPDWMDRDAPTAG